jgi:hypothetical protein
LCGGNRKTIGGTVNQFYAVVSGLGLAVQLGADVELPHLWERTTFDDPDAFMSPVPFSSLYDEAALVRYWQRRGLTIYPTGTAPTDYAQVFKILRRFVPVTRSAGAACELCHVCTQQILDRWDIKPAER